MPFKEGLTKAELRRGMSWVVPWWRAAEVQNQRLDGVRFQMDARTDAILFVVLLANFTRGVEALVDSDDPGLAEFKSQVPRAVDVRDLLTHFDDYIVGKGQLQTPKIAERRGVPLIDEFKVTFTFNSAVEIDVSGMTVAVAPALAAMGTLVRYLDKIFDQVPR